MRVFFLEKVEKNTKLLLAVAFMSAIVVLALSLSVISAVMTFVMACSIIIFDKSFSRGWLFVLSILLLFPQIKIGDGTILLNDIILLTLALIGLIKLSVSRDYKIKNNSFGKYFLMLSTLGVLLGTANMIFLKKQLNENMLLLTITTFLFLVILETFKYYFQTQKRIERFFKVIFIIAALHGAFGIIMMIGGWQTNTGMGISIITRQGVFFENAGFQVNGFFGVGLAGRTRANVLTPLLLLSIPIGAGFLKKLGSRKEKNRSNNNESEKKQTYVGWLVGYVANLTKAEILVLSALAIQIVALFLTYSYLSLIFLAFSLLAMGILDRKKGLIIVSVSVIIVLSAIVPSMKSRGDTRSIDISSNLTNFIAYSQNWLLGSEFIDETAAAESLMRISNSYVFIWKTYGIIGLVIVLSMLYKYLKDLLWSYKKSDGTRRIWLISIISASIAYIPEAAIGNVLFFGPSALVFWLFSAACMNLRKKDVIFGITESRISN